MKKRDSDAQFACAWIADGRQILAYLWEQEDQYYVEHKSMDPTLRLSFALNFKTMEDAWAYFHALRTSTDGTRQKVENIFEGMFEQAGKEYENEDDKGGPPLED